MTSAVRIAFEVIFSSYSRCTGRLVAEAYMHGDFVATPSEAKAVLDVRLLVVSQQSFLML